MASKVKGTDVYDKSGAKIGHIEDIILDKQSDRILFAALGFGGVLGVGQKYYPIPWSLLDYNSDQDGYVVPITQSMLESAPFWGLDDLTRGDGTVATLRERSYDYYKVPPDW